MTSHAATSRGVDQYRASETHVAILDRMYPANGTRRGIIYLHGVGQVADDWRVTLYGVEDKIRALVAAGYPVISADLCAPAYAVGANWGNADAIAAITAAASYLRTTFGASASPIGLLGASMGALGALAWARANLADCFAVAAMIPVLDLNDAYTNAGGFTAGFVPGIALAYAQTTTTVAAGSNGVDTATFAGAGVLNVASSAAYAATGTLVVMTNAGAAVAVITYTGKGAGTFTGCTRISGTGTLATGNGVYDQALPSLATHSPVAFGGADLAGLPVGLWTSTNDPVASNTADANAWGGAGSTKTVTDYGAHGHDATLVNPDQIVAFFDAAGGRT